MTAIRFADCEYCHTHILIKADDKVAICEVCMNKLLREAGVAGE